MPDTKKVLHTGRFGSRYGRGIRTRVLKVEIEQRKKHECPFCEKPKIKRIAGGLFECRSCSAKFTGGAFTPTTMTGRIVSRTIRQKQFGLFESEHESIKKQTEMAETAIRETETRENKARNEARKAKETQEKEEHAPEELLPEDQ